MPSRTPAPCARTHVRLSEAAFVLQETRRSATKIAGAMRCADGSPARTWQGGLQVVDVQALRAHIGPDPDGAAFGPAEALDRIIRRGARIPPSPSRNGQPLSEGRPEREKARIGGPPPESGRYWVRTSDPQLSRENVLRMGCTLCEECEEYTGVVSRWCLATGVSAMKERRNLASLRQ